MRSPPGSAIGNSSRPPSYDAVCAAGPDLTRVRYYARRTDDAVRYGNGDMPSRIAYLPETRIEVPRNHPRSEPLQKGLSTISATTTDVAIASYERAYLSPGSAKAARVPLSRCPIHEHPSLQISILRLLGSRQAGR